MNSQEAGAGTINMTLDPNMNTTPVALSCSIQAEGAQRTLNFEVRNTSDAAIHVFDSDRMPYRILEADGTLLVLNGVNAPDPNVDYNFIEIPLTQELAPGASLAGQVELTPLLLADHYEKQRTPTEMNGSVQVKFQYAWGLTPITKLDRIQLSVTQVLEWQNLAEGSALTVDFP